MPRAGGLEFVFLALALIALAATAPLASLLQNTASNTAEPRPAPDFLLYDADGKPVSLRDFRGRTLFLMFGYLRCTDVCHAQVANLVALANRFEDENSVFLYLAMDRRDEPAALREYFDRRGQDFVSLHAPDTAAMQGVASAYRAAYRIAGNPAGDDYEIEHPAMIFLIDPTGRLRHSYRGIDPDLERIAADYRRIDSGNDSHFRSENPS